MTSTWTKKLWECGLVRTGERCQPLWSNYSAVLVPTDAGEIRALLFERCDLIHTGRFPNQREAMAGARSWAGTRMPLQVREPIYAKTG